MFHIIFLLSLLLSTSHASKVVEFCVADLSNLNGPAGYGCTTSVTEGDFVYSGISNAGNTSNLFNSSVTPASVAQFPAVNGLDISGARLDLAPGGVIPLHAHPSGSELLFVLQGRIKAGFISSASAVFEKTLNFGELMIFPQGLLHYQINAGEGDAVAFSSFSSPNPGFQILDSALFGSKISSAVVEKTTLIDDAEVQRLKAVFGGSG